ncbi:MAG: type II toxin-antitoxin system HicB family antitoxin [Methylococcaceae bacterium]|nr:MAG: type II toxin-antitoxin system HicB family antitoxin [Methylococcaceae bacterium]
MNKYPIELFWSGEDEGYIALVPDLPGCSAWGLTEEAAIGELRAAVATWISACERSGEPVPMSSKPLYAAAA